MRLTREIVEQLNGFPDVVFEGKDLAAIGLDNAVVTHPNGAQSFIGGLFVPSTHSIGMALKDALGASRIDRVPRLH